MQFTDPQQPAQTNWPSRISRGREHPRSAARQMVGERDHLGRRFRKARQTPGTVLPAPPGRRTIRPYDYGISKESLPNREVIKDIKKLKKRLRVPTGCGLQRGGSNREAPHKYLDICWRGRGPALSESAEQVLATRS
jgi:hypothetical protein